MNLQKKVQGRMKESRKSHAFDAPYESVRQMVLSGFETPSERELDKANHWVVLSHLIPWDEICGIYRKHTVKYILCSPRSGISFAGKRYVTTNVIQVINLSST
jgi:hypothetical protein